MNLKVKSGWILYRTPNEREWMIKLLCGKAMDDLKNESVINNVGWKLYGTPREHEWMIKLL